MVEMYNVKRLLKVFTELREKAFPLPQLLQNFTVTECIYKFVNGKILKAICRKNHGVGGSLIQDTLLY